MRIKIASRFIPFSKLPGTKTTLLGSSLLLQCYPGRILSSLFTLSLQFQGPCHDFTLFNDFETGVIRVVCRLERGFFRYVIYVEEDHVCIKVEKDTSHSLKLYLNEDRVDKVLRIPCRGISRRDSFEKLSLGSHKKQDIDLIRRRSDLKEIFPLWFLAGQWSDIFTVNSDQTLLGLVREAIKNNPRDELSKPFLNLFKASFPGIFAPRAYDEEFQGFNLPPIQEGASPFCLLSEGANYIRSLFVRSDESTLFLLPKLPSEFPCGRMVDVLVLEGSLKISFEWSKFYLSKVILTCMKPCRFTLALQAKIKTFRLRSSLKERGSSVDKHTELSMNTADTLFLDRFLH